MGANIWDGIVAIGVALNSAILVREHVMPRPKTNVKPDNVTEAGYPAWFAEYSEAQAKQQGAMQWLEEYEADDWKQLFLNVLGAGGAVFTALTRDGGAITLTVMFGDTKKRMYASTPEELDGILSKMR